MFLDDSLTLKFSKSQATALAQQIATEVRRAQDARRAFDDRVAGYWERFEGSPPRRKPAFPKGANVRVMLTYWTIRSVWVRTMRTVFGQDPFIQVGDENLSLGGDSSLAQEVLQHLCLVDLKLRGVEGHGLLNAFVEGTGILKIGQDIAATRTVRDREDDILVERQIVDRVGLRLDAVDLKDFWVANPAIADLDRQPWVAHRVWLRWDDIVRRQRDGIYEITRKQLDELKPHGITRRAPDGSRIEQVKADLDRTDERGFGPEEYAVLEVQYRTDVDKDGLEEEGLFALVPSCPEFLLRAQRAPWWNGKRGYFAIRPIPRANRFYGMSLAAVLQGQQDEIDTRVNQNLDANTIAILAALTPILPRHLKAEWEKHVWELAKPLYVDSPETFGTLGSILKALPHVEQVDVQQQLEFSRQTSGVTEPFLAQPAGGRTTAFEISTIQHEGNINFQEMIEQVQETNRELGYQVLEQAYQLAQEQPEFAERLVRVSGGKDPFEGLTMRDLRNRWDLKPYGNTIISNKDLEAKKAMAAFQLFKEDGFVNADLTRARYLRERVLKGIGFNPEEIDKIIGAPEEIEALKQHALQQMQMGMQQGMQQGMQMGAQQGMPQGMPQGMFPGGAAPEVME